MAHVRDAVEDHRDRRDHHDLRDHDHHRDRRRDRHSYCHDRHNYCHRDENPFEVHQERPQCWGPRASQLRRRVPRQVETLVMLRESFFLLQPLFISPVLS
jgi:hypothetical protein